MVEGEALLGAPIRARMVTPQVSDRTWLGPVRSQDDELVDTPSEYSAVCDCPIDTST